MFPAKSAVKIHNCCTEVIFDSTSLFASGLCKVLRSSVCAHPSCSRRSCVCICVGALVNWLPPCAFEIVLCSKIEEFIQVHECITIKKDMLLRIVTSPSMPQQGRVKCVLRQFLFRSCLCLSIWLFK